MGIGALKARCHYLLQFIWVSPNPLPRAFEHGPEIVQITLQTFVPGPFFVIHLGTRLAQKLRVGLGLDAGRNRGSTSARYRARTVGLGKAPLQDLNERT